MKKYEVCIYLFDKTSVYSSSHVIRSYIVEADNVYDCMQKVLDVYVATLHFPSNYKVEISEIK